MTSYRMRRIIALTILLVFMAIPLAASSLPHIQPSPATQTAETKAALKKLSQLAVKGRAPKTDYSRSQFGNGWQDVAGCDMRNIILARDLTQPRFNLSCQVLGGTLNDPYTGAVIAFARGETTSDDVQIDHVVALSDAWQKGAQQLSYIRRVAFANDPLNLLAVDGPTNEQKSDSDAASWLPPHKPFRCQYVSRQISVKAKYDLWVTPAEKQAMQRVLGQCA